MSEYVISDFSISLQGESHIKKGIICQDYSGTKKINAKNNKRFIIAAVADGLGSCVKSDEGSKMAVTSSISCIESYLTEGINFDGIIREDILRKSFTYTLSKINEEADRTRISQDAFFTTLTLAIYDIDTHEIIYGHSGDGGLIALTEGGKLTNLTPRLKVQGQALNFVRPLADTSCWTFGKCSNIAAFSLMTDGLYDLISPVYREFQDYTFRNYVPFFNSLFYARSSDSAQTELIRKQWIDLLNSSSIRDKVKDDISLVCIVNQSMIATIPPIKFDEEEAQREALNKTQDLYKALYPNIK